VWQQTDGCVWLAADDTLYVAGYALHRLEGKRKKTLKAWAFRRGVSPAPRGENHGVTSVGVLAALRKT
jgi:hypothetical protein